MTTPTNLKAGELRIRNWVNHKGEYQKVFSLSQGWLRILPKNKPIKNSVSYDNISGIPLTEDILVKCGFSVRDDNPKKKPHYDGDILFNILDFTFSNSMEDGFHCYELNEKKVVYKYLHQLQNLYFALTGEELKIEL